MNDHRPGIADFFFFCAVLSIFGVGFFVVNNMLWQMAAVKHHAASWVTDDKTGDVNWKWNDEVEKK